VDVYVSGLGLGSLEEGEAGVCFCQLGIDGGFFTASSSPAIALDLK
jgi:hypothetical protein